MTTKHLDISTLESRLWEAACKIQGPVDAPKYKDYIIPLIFLKRLSNVFADEVQRLGEEYGDPEFANAFAMTGDSKFAAAVGQAWRFIEKRRVDRVHGDWFKETDPTGNIISSHPKAGFWDCPYHHARACFELIERSSRQDALQQYPAPVTIS